MARLLRSPPLPAPIRLRDGERKATAGFKTSYENQEGGDVTDAGMATGTPNLAMLS